MERIIDQIQTLKIIHSLSTDKKFKEQIEQDLEWFYYTRETAVNIKRKKTIKYVLTNLK